MGYAPIPGPLPGEPFNPSNASAGESFIEHFCCNCQRDKSMREGIPFEDCAEDEICHILGASFGGGAEEWRRMPDGAVTCLCYVPAGEPIPTSRCSETIDMFSEA